MSRRAVPLVAGEFYHLYNRGHNRRPICLEPASYGFFVRQFRRYVADSEARVIAYVLMPNHYHVLVQALSDNLSSAMQRFGISYVKAINKRFDRVGSLFQGAFQASLVNCDEYLLHLSRYLHLNPVRARLVVRAEDWEFSSYREFVGLRAGTLPQPQAVLDAFVTTKADLGKARQRYRVFVESYQAADREKIAHLLFND